MPRASLHDLFLEDLRDLYHAETQLLKALPRMAKAADARELRLAFEEHLEVTRGQVGRLDRPVRRVRGESEGEEEHRHGRADRAGPRSDRPRRPPGGAGRGPDRGRAAGRAPRDGRVRGGAPTPGCSGTTTRPTSCRTPWTRRRRRTCG